MNAIARAILMLVVSLGTALAARAVAAEPATPPAAPPNMPVIQTPWIQIAGDPDLGQLSTAGQQPVDFAIWPAQDGTWQLWSCIRGTNVPGKSRLFYHWQTDDLTDANWRPQGIALQADPQVGEIPGGLQAPFVFRDAGHYEMFYGAWETICSATSSDGKYFVRRLNAAGKSALFGSADGYSQIRDPMLLKIAGLWHCYYTAHTDRSGADFCRTSKDLLTWSEPKIVASGGQAGSEKFSCECPFVVQRTPGHYYLFRTQSYGAQARTSVYHSLDPLDFGIDDDAGHFVGTLPIAAPEIILHQGQYYVAALLPSLKGIQLARLDWGSP